mgnify:CR=1 FL=1
MRILFPMTADLITPGHILCLEYLSRKGFVVVGLLTDKALKGYKQNVVPFSDRKFVLEALAEANDNIFIANQDSLNPTEVIEKYKCDAIASGDGFEKAELEAIKKFKLKKIDIKFGGEVTKKYGSSMIKEKICKQK